MSQILTFYSYKGGVGRTMALANIAVLLSQKKKKVLIVDWDLEAPGLEYYFRDFLKIEKVKKVLGIINLLNAHNNLDQYKQNITWHDCVIKFKVKGSEISLITSGKKDVDKNEQGYFSLVRDLDVEHFYEERQGGEFIESLRNEWKSEYDYILIDSRTGITDIGGICTIQLPDVLFLLFSANEQNLEGIAGIAKKVVKERNKIPFDRFSLIAFPISSRFDAQAEFEISQAWLNKFGIELKDNFSNWLPKTITSREFIEITKIPYIPYFSFGEKLPIIEQGVSDPTGLGFSYETIASIIANNFENIETVLLNRGLISPPLKTLDAVNESQSKKPPFYDKDVIQKRKYRLDIRGMLSILTMLVSLAALSLSMFGAARFLFDVLGTESDNKLEEIPAKLVVLGFTFFFGWVVGQISIRSFGNLVYPIIVQIYAWGCLLAVGILYLMVIQKLFMQAYSPERFLTYLLMLLGGLFVLLSLHLMMEHHDLRPFAIPLLVISVIQLFAIIIRYVFVPDPNGWMLFGDLTIFGVMVSLSALMFMKISIFSRVSDRINELFITKENYKGNDTE